MQEVRYVDTAAEKRTKTVLRKKYTITETRQAANSRKMMSWQRKSPEHVSRQAAEIYCVGTRTTANNRKTLPRQCDGKTRAVRH
jgi:hypothetical protein